MKKRLKILVVYLMIISMQLCLLPADIHAADVMTDVEEALNDVNQVVGEANAVAEASVASAEDAEKEQYDFTKEIESLDYYVTMDHGEVVSVEGEEAEGFLSDTQEYNVGSSSEETTVYNYLRNTCGLNIAATCGVLANIYYESRFNANAVGDSGTSYGICQWHNERWTALKAYCPNDWTTLNGQLRYLKKELEEGTHCPGVYTYLKNSVSNNSDGAYNAALKWVSGFERPAKFWCTATNKGYSSRHCASCRDVYAERTSKARDYWTQYGGSNPTTFNKINFDRQGGKIDLAYKTYTASGVNIERGTDKLVLYTNAGATVNTNVYGEELVVRSDGRVIQKRAYGDSNQLKVPVEGFVLSAHGAALYDFVSQIKIGDYVGYNPSNLLVSAYQNENAYIMQHKYVQNGARYGLLPGPWKDGYIFDGWYTAANGGSKVTAESIYSVPTLYAHWIPEAQHTHSYNSGKVTKAATCVEAGVKTYTCSCGATKTEKIAALGHDPYDSYTIDRKATVDKAGSKSIHCKRCNAVKNVTSIPRISTYTIYKGKTAKLPTSATASKWKTSNKKVVKVTSGTIKGLKKGTATITVTVGGKNYTCKVTVKNCTISVNKTKVTLKKGATCQLQATPTPDAKVTWSASKKSVATVNSNGLVTAKKKGKCTITVKANGVKKNIKVTVK